jgi:hypothetical protein
MNYLSLPQKDFLDSIAREKFEATTGSEHGSVHASLKRKKQKAKYADDNYKSCEGLFICSIVIRNHIPDCRSF